jgi:hypothetical protein
MIEKVKLIPHEVILVTSIPACNFCKDGTSGPYDFKTVMGPWANGCYDHYRMYAAFPTLGTGKAQLWVTEDQVAWTPIQEAKRAAAKERGWDV